MKAVVVTGTTNPVRAAVCFASWGDVPRIVVVNGLKEGTPPAGPNQTTWVLTKDYLGTVPAFRLGVDHALKETDADVICCLHDDLEMLDPDWLGKTLRHFERNPACGLAGYGGAIGLGAEDIYQTPYNPMQLARIGFRSNLVDAEVHGIRSILSERVACLDGFSQVGRREFWLGQTASVQWTGTPGQQDFQRLPTPRLADTGERPLTYLEDHGMVHHFYDGALGCLAARHGWETWYLPVRCRHYGGQTAVGDAGYQTWAKAQIPGGDQGFWEQSHRRGYELFTDVLPLRV